MPFTSRGAPFPAPGDNNNVPADVYALAQFIHDNFGVSDVDETARDSLTGGDLWDGRVLSNTTAKRAQRYDAGSDSWITLLEQEDLDNTLTSYQRRLARATLTSGIKTTTSGTPVEVDPTLACTFTVPRAGQVDVVLSGLAQSSQADAGKWSLLDGSGGITGSANQLYGQRAVNWDRHRFVITVTGLTPGASLTWKWAYQKDGASGDSTQIQAGVMEVHG